MTKEAAGKPSVLVVDDSFANRALLRKILSQDYDITEAENGLCALKTLRDHPDIAAVMLDIHMPELSGDEVLRIMRSDECLHDIPVIVATSYDDVDSQMAALENGADDVLVKPLNPKIVLCRVRNIVARREATKKASLSQALEDLLRQAETDEKTGIPGKQAFCRKAAEMMRSHPDRFHVIVQWDIDRFKVFNDIFGIAAGDAYLAKAGAMCREKTGPEALFGHWEADRFVACMSMREFERSGLDLALVRFAASLVDDFEFVPRLGVYEVDDLDVDVAIMCDRALLALRSIKGDYSTRIAYYDEAMRDALIEEQEMVGEMDRALEQGWFVVYLQPQYNHAKRAVCGAEALVRWVHPEKGLIPPDKFIPAFERNGFISKLDEYVWEQVAKRLRIWIDSDKPVVPISVNVSRRDIYNPDLCGTLEALMERFDLPRALLKLEITESAYTKNADQLIRTVESLRAAGFSVEMDDFGSGYSSLNMLREVPVDKLKLDMKFLGRGGEDVRGSSILTSVIRMANWIGLPVIAEGVETREQADYLNSVGCACVQGYYYAKPMPVEEFEALMEKEVVNADPPVRFAGSIDGAEDFLSASAQATLLFNSFVGGAAIIEYDGENVEALRMNDRFFEVLGTTRDKYVEKQLRLNDRFDEENGALFLSAIREAIETNEEIDRELRSLPLGCETEGVWTSVRMRLLARAETRYILYVLIENISYRVRLAERLKAIMDGVPGGILDFEKTDRARVTYFNDSAASIFGFGRDEYGRLVERDPLSMVHPDDLEAIRSDIRKMLSGSSQSSDATYRHLCADGSWRWTRLRSQVTRRQGDNVFASGVLIDVDKETRSSQIVAEQAKELERQRKSLQSLYDTVPCGIMQFASSAGTGGIAGLLSFNDAAWKIFGYGTRSEYVEAVHGRSKFKDVHPEDLAELKEVVAKLLGSKSGERAALDHRIVRQDGSVRWVHAELQKMRFDEEEGEVLQVAFVDVTVQKQQDAKKLSDALFGLYDEIFEFDEGDDSCIMRSAKDPNDQRVGRATRFSAHLDTLCSRYALPEEGPRIRAFYGRACDHSAAPETIEYRYALDGEVRWASATVVHVNGSKYLTCNRDITGRKSTEHPPAEADALLGQADGRQSGNRRNDGLAEGTEPFACDVEDERRREQELKAIVEERDRCRIVIEQTGIAVVDMDHRTGRFAASEAYDRYEISRYDLSEVISKAANPRLVHPDDQARLEAFFAAYESGAGSAAVDLRLKMSDGSYQWTRMAGSFLKDENGERLHSIGTLVDIDEGFRAKASSERLANRLSRIVSEIPVGIAIYEMGSIPRPVYVSDRACELLGCTESQCSLCIANGEQIGFCPDEKTLGEENAKRLWTKKPVAVDRFRPSGVRGEGLWLRIFCSISTDNDEEPLCYAVVADITKEVERDQERAWQAERCRLLSEVVGAITFDYSPFDDTMRVSVTLPEGGSTEEVHERYLASLGKDGHIPEEAKPNFAKTLCAACRRATDGVYDFQSDRYRGEVRWYRAKYTSLADDAGKVYRVVGRLDDIDDIMTKQDQLREASQVDGLSGVKSKNYAVSLIVEALQAKDPSRLDAVIFLDLDNFKHLNDMFGHLRADDALKEVGGILKSIFRNGDIVARFGGDEFIVYMRSIAGPESVKAKARTVLEAVGGIEIEGRKIVRCSIGIAVVAGSGTSYDEALDRADKALYEAKRQGKGRYAVFDE